MRCIGITGGIGSGKSQVLSFLHEKGYSVLSADRKIGEFYEKDSFLIARVQEIAPDVFQDGKIQKALLRDWAMHPHHLKRLSAILHPYFFIYCQAWLQKQSLLEKPYAFIEVPLLFEVPYYRTLFHQVMTVYAPFEVREKRLIHQRGLSPEQVHYMDSQQLSLKSEYLALADHVIRNDCSRFTLKKRIEDVLCRL